MRRLLVVIVMAAPMFAQRPPRRPMPLQTAQQAEMAVKGAMERLGNERKGIEIMLNVLTHVRAADRALVDPMQPTIAVQKSFEEISEAERLNASPYLAVGLIRTRQAIDDARKSPAAADFGHLRNVLREYALGPVQREVVRAASAIHDETVQWLAVQELIGAHLKSLADITATSLRAANEE